MIEMNLSASPAYIVGNYSGKNKKNYTGIFFFAVFLASIPFAALFLAKTLFSVSEEKEIEKEIASAEIAANSRRSEESVTEDIIDSVSAVREAPVIDKKYEDMAKFERLDYEVKFTALALEQFTKVISSGLTFSVIKISDYKTLVAEGTAPDRQTVSAMLTKLRAGNWELLAKPKTSITDGGSFYYFRIEALYLPPMSSLLKNPLNPEDIPYTAHLDGVKRKITAAAKNSGVKTAGLSLKSSKNEPDEKKFVYTMKLGGSFADILKFLKSVSQIKEPVRVQDITMKNRAKSIETTVTIVINSR